ncbi:MAG: hypothetical protein SFX18_17665 [Pirellulales bacterium]|nr:hypothetical protein [Pirellulales bacterium]
MATNVQDATMDHKNRLNGHFPDPNPKPNSSQGRDINFDLDEKTHDKLTGHAIYEIAPEHAASLPEHAAAALFPIYEVDVKRLTLSIQQFEQQVPIVLYEGKVLDGRCRIRACVSLNLPVLAVQFADCDLNGFSPKQWVLHRNRTATDGRRMTDVEYALIVATVYGAEASEQASLRMKGGVAIDDVLRGPANELLAMAFNLSPSLMKQAMKISKAGEPELIELVKTKKLSLSKADEILKLPKAQRKAAMNDPKRPLPLASAEQALKALKITLKLLDKTEKRILEITGSKHFNAVKQIDLELSLKKLRDAISGLQPAQTENAISQAESNGGVA